MIYLYIFLPIYIVAAISIFLIINKRGSKKNPLALNIFYAAVLLVPYPIEALIMRMTRAKYKKATPQVFKALNKAGVKYHAVFGTFLFSYRDNNFADNDIDIAVFKDEFTKSQQKLVKDLGFVLKEQWSLDGKICEQTYINKKFKVSMDIFQMSRGEEFAPTFDEKNNRYARRPKTYKYDLKEYEVEGIKFMGPANGEEYLSGNYGNGREKDPNYHGFHGSSSYPTVIVENANIEYKKFD